MRKLFFISLSSLLIFTFLGCVTIDKNVGKRLQPNYYVCNCESFPAQGVQGDRNIEISYQISKIENHKYQITGTLKPIFGGGLARAEEQDLVIVFF